MEMDEEDDDGKHRIQDKNERKEEHGQEEEQQFKGQTHTYDYCT